MITGRGNQSHARVPVVREAVRRLLHLLSTRGVVLDHNEHSPGSFAVRLAPITGSQSSPRKGRGDPVEPALPIDPPTLDGLSETTREQLRTLASTTLDSLGVRAPSPRFVHDEMVRLCAELAKMIPVGASANEQEKRLADAIRRALESLQDDLR